MSSKRDEVHMSGQTLQKEVLWLALIGIEAALTLGHQWSDANSHVFS